MRCNIDCTHTHAQRQPAVILAAHARRGLIKVCSDDSLWVGGNIGALSIGRFQCLVALVAGRVLKDRTHFPQ